MMDAMIAGERNPKVLAEMARAGMRKKREALVEALTGNFEDHHAHLTALILGTIDHLTAQIEELSTAIERALSDLPTPDGPGGGSGSAMGLIGHLDEVPGIGPATAQVILAEVGLDMSVFPTPDHLVSWAKLCPRTIQSGNKNTSGKTGKGNSWLKRALGEAAMAAAKTDTFLGARYRRLVKRKGHAKALVAVARSMLVIIWHLINDPTIRYTDLGADHHQRWTDPVRKTRDLVRQLQALGHEVALTPQPAA
jgi:transposase